MPQIIVEMDYDGYFERLGRRIVELAENTGKPLWCETVVITAGPYRTYALDVSRRDPSTAHLDFYSAIRKGYGSLPEADLQRAADLLLQGGTPDGRGHGVHLEVL
jgi:hypothetical protein